MGLFDRLRALVSSNVHAGLDGIESPERSIAIAIDGLRTEMQGARAALLEARAEKKRLDAKADEHEGDAARWESRAAEAVRAGDDALAREGLARKLAELKKARSSRELAAAREADEARVRDLLERAEEKLRELESRKASLAADLRRARTVGGTGSSTGLEASLERVDRLEAELTAHDLVDPMRDASVAAEFRKLEKSEGDSRVDDELAALKRKLGG